MIKKWPMYCTPIAYLELWYDIIYEMLLME